VVATDDTDTGDPMLDAGGAVVMTGLPVGAGVDAVVAGMWCTWWYMYPWCGGGWCTCGWCIGYGGGCVMVVPVMAYTGMLTGGAGAGGVAYR
jgi:hypothetical protein